MIDVMVNDAHTACDSTGRSRFLALVTVRRAELRGTLTKSLTLRVDWIVRNAIGV